MKATGGTLFKRHISALEPPCRYIISPPFTVGDNGRIRKVDGKTGVISTVAGGGIPKREGGILVTGDGGPATGAWFKKVTSVAVDSRGNLYFTETNRLRKVDAETGIITSLAGTGNNDLSGDGGPSPDAGIADPNGVAVDEGNVYLADTLNQRIRRIDAATEIITTVAGIGKHPPYTLPGPEYGTQPLGEGKGLSGDGGPAVEAMLSGPQDIAIGPDGNLYIADTENDRVRMVDLSTGVITSIVHGGAETGEAMQTGFTGGGGREMSFEHFSPPVSIALGSGGAIYLSDLALNKVVRIIP